MVELLPSILEALGLIPSTADKNIESTNSIPLKKKTKKVVLFLRIGSRQGNLLF